MVWVTIHSLDFTSKLCTNTTWKRFFPTWSAYLNIYIYVNIYLVWNSFQTYQHQVQQLDSQSGYWSAGFVAPKVVRCHSECRVKSDPPMNWQCRFSRNGSCDWRRSTYATEMFLHLEMSSVRRRLQCCTSRNNDLEGFKGQEIRELIHLGVGCEQLWGFSPLTCQWCYRNRKGRDAAVCRDTAQLVPRRSRWCLDSSWAPGWWGCDSGGRLTPSWRRWSPSAWTERGAGGPGNAPPEERTTAVTAGLWLRAVVCPSSRCCSSTCVMLLSVILGHAERSRSCSLLRANSEAPACCLNCSRSSCVTSLGRSSKGRRGSLKKPMMPNVPVNLGPLSPCRDICIIPKASELLTLPLYSHIVL